jgi:hypothetical protein
MRIRFGGGRFCLLRSFFLATPGVPGFLSCFFLHHTVVPTFAKQRVGID